MIFDKKLDKKQKEMLAVQLSEYLRLSKLKRIAKNQIEVDENGKLVLKEGTLIHGTVPSIDVLKSISKLGILNSEYFNRAEDNETFYCADFFRVPKKMTMEEYFNFCKETERTRDGAKKAKMEASKLPARSQNSIAFIVDINNPDLEQLLRNDPYRDNGEKSDYMKQIVNFDAIKEFYKSKERISAVLWGIPANYISGIWVGDDILEDSQKIEQIKTLFPNSYITTKEGNIIYKGINKDKTVLQSAEEVINENTRTGKVNKQSQMMKAKQQERIHPSIEKDSNNRSSDN